VCVCVCVQLQANYEFPAAFPHSGALRGSVKNQKPKTKMKKTILSIASLSLAFAASGSAALTLLADPISHTASSQINAGEFNAGNLYDGTVTLADLGTTANQGGQYAGSGVGPHYMVYNMGSTIDLGGIVYAQRAGANSSTDKVTSIDFWLQNSNPGTVTSDPGAAIDHTLTVTNTANNNLTEYDFGSTVASGQYVIMKMTGNGGNPGGSELVLGTFVPEPSTTALLGLGGLALILRRRK
jgi:hypothetical protein